MSYIDAGYNQFLTREENISQSISPLEFENSTPEFSGSKIQGLIQSQDGRVKVDLDNNSFIVSDGIVERIRLGKLVDGSYGLSLLDKDGNQLMQLGDNNFIQSPSGVLRIDFDQEYILVSDSNTPIILLGRQDNGF